MVPFVLDAVAEPVLFRSLPSAFLIILILVLIVIACALIWRASRK